MDKKPKNDESENDDGIERVNQKPFHDLQLEKEIKEECDKLIKKYFDDRKYVDSKVKNWGDAFLKDLESFCKTKTKYIFYLILRIDSKNSLWNYSYKYKIRNKKDGYYYFVYKLPFLKISFDVIYIEKFNAKKIINFDINSFQNQIKIMISNVIDERSYSKEKIKEYLKYISTDSIKNILSISKNCYYISPCIMVKCPKLTTICYKAVNITENEFCFSLNYSTNEISCEIGYFIYIP